MKLYMAYNVSYMYRGARDKQVHRVSAITFEGKELRGLNFHTFLALKPAQKRVKIRAFYDPSFKSYAIFSNTGIQIWKSFWCTQYWIFPSDFFDQLQ